MAAKRDTLLKRSSSQKTDHDEDDTAEVSPDWNNIKPFGAGLKRKRIAFVPATSCAKEAPTMTTSKLDNSVNGSSISDYYLSLVLPRNSSLGLSADSKLTRKPQTDTSMPMNIADTTSSLEMDSTNGLSETKDISYCETCKTEISTDMQSHTQTIAHMSNETHSEVPHHHNRKSEGYKHMVGLGWDPDKRQGLGPTGRGIQYPIKVKEKKDLLGIGAKPTKLFENSDDQQLKRPKVMNAKEARAHQESEKEKRMSMHQYLSSR